MRIFGPLLPLLATAGLTGTARAQEFVSQVPLTTSNGAVTPYGGGYANGHVYFCAGDSLGSTTGAVWKVATGNANGPSNTAPSNVGNPVTITDSCYDGLVSPFSVQ